MGGVMISLSVGFLICKMGVRRLSLPRKAGGSSKFGGEVRGPRFRLRFPRPDCIRVEGLPGSRRLQIAPALPSQLQK